MGHFSEQALNMTMGQAAEDREMDRTDGVTSGQQAIIARYERLTAASKSGHCFVCDRRRPLVNALVQGPNPTSVGGPVAGRGHGVCRPCIKAGEAAALR